MNKEEFLEAKRRNFKKWYSKNKEKSLLKSSIYYRNNKDKVRNLDFKRRYKSSLEEYNKLLLDQNSSCKICNIHESKLYRKLCIDHDHTTGKIRGLLCYRCNTGLGGFQDNIDNLNNAIKYLQDANT